MTEKYSLVFFCCVILAQLVESAPPPTTSSGLICPPDQTLYYTGKLASPAQNFMVDFKLFQDKIVMIFVAPIDRWFGLGFADSAPVPGLMNGTDAIVSGIYHGIEYAAVEATLGHHTIDLIDTTIDLAVINQIRISNHYIVAERPTVPQAGQTPADFVIPFPPINLEIGFIWAVGTSANVNMGHFYNSRGYTVVAFQAHCLTAKPTASPSRTSQPSDATDSSESECLHGHKTVSCDPYIYSDPKFSNRQRVLPLCAAINFDGPDLSSVPSSQPVPSFLGQVKWFHVPCSDIPHGFIACDGSFIFNNGTTQALYLRLFGDIGTARQVYDCRDRILVGSSSISDLGDCRGQDEHTWNEAEMPAITFENLDVSTSNCTDSCKFLVKAITTVDHEPADIDNRQQLIYVRYFIVARGTTPVVGTIVASFLPYSIFDDNPGRFVPCDGRELNQTDFPDLFALLISLSADFQGSVSKFFVPNCQERTLTGAGPQQTGAGQAVQQAIMGGEAGGHNFFALSAENIDGNNIAANIATDVSVYGTGCRVNIQASGNGTCEDISNMMSYIGVYFYEVHTHSYHEIATLLGHTSAFGYSTRNGTTGLTLIAADDSTPIDVVPNTTSNVISCYHIDYVADKTIHWRCCPTTERPSPGQWWVPSSGPTSSPSNAPTQSPTSSPTNSPSVGPSNSPTFAPTNAPSDAPSVVPTSGPTPSPTDPPTTAPSDAPSDGPTSSPTDHPTSAPSDAPSQAPTTVPSASPTAVPTGSPTSNPTANPTGSPSTTTPTGYPTLKPTRTRPPFKVQTNSPSAVPSTHPSLKPTSNTPTRNPTRNPTRAPTDTPTVSPTDAPTDCPSSAPSDAPTTAPTVNPTVNPTENPTQNPTQNPTKRPSHYPTTTTTITTTTTTIKPTSVCICEADPEWSEWSDWSDCVFPRAMSTSSSSETALSLDHLRQCRTFGLTYRKRSCQYAEHCCPESQIDLSVGGVGYANTQSIPLGLSQEGCDGNAVEFDFCIRCVPIDGKWSPWCVWTSCVNGTRSRARTCTEPEASCGGHQCDGSAIQFESCQECYWTPFGKWSSCIEGKQTRNRFCVQSNGESSADAADCSCQGSGHETRDCDATMECLSIFIQHDDHANDISWEVLDIDGTSVSHGLQTTNSESCIRVYSQETYFFKVHDAFGDGICCQSGHGFISWAVHGEELGRYDEDALWHVKVFAITIPAADNCLQMEVHGNNVEFENQWEVENLNGIVVAQGADIVPDQTSCIFTPPSATETQCFVFTVFDSQQNGICCEQDGMGYIRLFYNGQVVGSYRTDNQELFDQKSIDFCLD